MRFAGRSLAWPILSVSVEASCGLPQRHHPLVALDAVARGTGSNRIGDKARGKMAIMPLDHAAVGVTQVLRHHQQRRAVHDGKRSPGMAQDVEADPGLDLAVRARLSHRPRLLRLLPRAAIAVTEHQFMPTAARTMTPEESGTLLRQHHMARLAALALPDRQRAGVGIEVAHFQLRKLAVAAAGFPARRAPARENLVRTC